MPVFLLVPAVVFSTAAAAFGKRKLVGHAGDVQLERQASQEGDFVGAEPAHGAELVVVDGARGQSENRSRFLHSAAQADQSDDFRFTGRELVFLESDRHKIT